MIILSIDPGTTESAITLYSDSDAGGKILEWHKLDNHTLLADLFARRWQYGAASIEQLACYGMAVGREVFQTAFWTGRFAAALAFKTGTYFRGHEPLFIERREVKMFLCHSMKAKDGNIRQAIIDLLGPQGTKRSPGPTYGVAGDGWASLALAITTANTIKLTASSL